MIKNVKCQLFQNIQCKQAMLLIKLIEYGTYNEFKIVL